VGRDRMGEPPRFLTSLARTRGQSRAPGAEHSRAGSYRPLTWSLTAILVVALRGMDGLVRGVDGAVRQIVAAVVGFVRDVF
jgi:hypothetical protein